MILNTSSFIRNRQKDKFFGIDYYANLCHGSNPIYNYLSTPLDFYPLANHKAPSRSLDREQEFIKRLHTFDGKKIFGFFENPDIYQCHESIKPLIDQLKETEHGMFIETNALNLLNDIEALDDFSKDHPLLIGIPVSVKHLNQLSIFSHQDQGKTIDRLVRALHKSSIKYGFIIKPIIPYLNDDIKGFNELLARLIDFKPDFIYPTFSLNFDSRKLNNFYDLISLEKPELKTKLFDLFGHKKSWISPNASQLKRHFIFNIKKTKIAYAMHQIIDLYKQGKHNSQISLF